jgi:S-DNA-T family DNA segregation ATPase FtsK/SpoIIIE
MYGRSPVALVVDDAELLRDCSAKDYLREVVRTAADRTRAVLIAGNAAEVCAGFSGWQVDLRKNRHGALLSPQQITDGDLVGVRVPRGSVGGAVTPGRALLHDGGGELVTVQVPY